MGHGIRLRHDHFFLEPARGYYKEQRTHGEQNEGVEPEVHEAGATKDDSASDVAKYSVGHSMPRSD